MSNPTLNPSVLNQAKSMMGLKPTDSITTESLAALSHADRVRILSFMKTAGDMEKIDSVVALGKNLRAQSLMTDVAENPVSKDDPFIQSPAMSDALSAMATGNGRALKNNRAGEGITLDTIQGVADDGLVPGWFGREAEAIQQGETTDLQGVAIGPSGVRLLPPDSTEHQQLFDIPGNRKPFPEGYPRFGPGGEWEAYLEPEQIVIPKSLLDRLNAGFEAIGLAPTTIAEAKGAFAQGGRIPGPGPLFQLVPGLDFGAKETDYIASAFVGNFMIALTRLPFELTASAIEDPVQFTRDLVAFPFEQAAELGAAASKVFPSMKKTEVVPASDVIDFMKENINLSPQVLGPSAPQKKDIPGLRGTTETEQDIIQFEENLPAEYIQVSRKFTPEEQEEAIQSLFNSGALGVAFLASVGIKPIRGALKKAKVEKAVTELKTGVKQAERFAEITKEVKPEELARIEAEEGVITGKEKPEVVSRETKPGPVKPKRVKPKKEGKSVEEVKLEEDLKFQQSQVEKFKKRVDEVGIDAAPELQIAQERVAKIKAKLAKQRAKPKRVKPDKEVKPEKELAEVEAFEEPPKKPAPTKEQFKKTATGKALSGEGAIKIDAETGLPNYIRKPPEGFFSQVLAASRVVRATIRWDALNKGTKGRFTREIEAEIAKDKIQVSDIRNVHEGTHELGHALDHFLNTTLEIDGKRFKVGKVSEFTMTDRFGTTFAGKKVSNRQLRSEASQVSFHYRPTEGPMTKTHARYRNRGTEMMADFNAMYILDPVKTRTLAPTLTAMFEKKLETQPTVKALIEELHAGNVSPRIKELPGIIEIVAPDKARTRMIRDITQKDPKVGEAVRPLILEADSEISVRSFAARQTVAEARKRFGITEDQWKDVGAASEGTGNVFKPGDTIEAVKSRMTPEMNKALNWYRSFIEEQRQDLNVFLKTLSEKEFVDFLEDYLPHFFLSEGPISLKAKISTLKKRSDAIRERKFWTYKDATDAGFIPITTDAAKLAQMWTELNWRYAATREIMGTLKDMTDSFGNPLIFEETRKKPAPSFYVKTDSPIFRKLAEVAEKDGKKVFIQKDLAIHPELEWAMRGLLDKSPFSDIRWIKSAQRFNAWAKSMALSFSLFHHGAITESANSVLAGNPLRGVVMFQWTDPITGKKTNGITMPHRVGKKLLEIPELTEDAIRHRLQIGNPIADVQAHVILNDMLAAQAKLQSLSAKNPNAAKSALFKVADKAIQGARIFKEGWDKALWDSYHSGIKMFAYYDIFQKELRRNPAMSPEAIKQTKLTIAEHLNNALGGQDWLGQFWLDPRMQKAAQLGLLAPDWTLSNIKIAAETFSLADKRVKIAGKEVPLGVTLAKDPLTRRLQLRYWRRMAMTITGSTMAIQTAIFEAFGDESLGDNRFFWDNEAGHRTDIDVTPLMRQLPGAMVDFFADDPRFFEEGGRSYIHFGKQARELVNWINNPFEAALSKGSPIVQVMSGFFEKTNLFGRPDELTDKSVYEYLTDIDDGFVENVGKQFTPFSFRGNNFFLTAPLSKGMTASKARTAYIAMLRNYADPSLTRQFFDEGIKGANDYFTSPDFVLNKERFLFGPGSIGKDITDAARANGVDIDAVYSSAMRQVQGFYIGRYAKMMTGDEEPSEDELERLSTILVRLGVGVESILKFHQEDLDLDVPPIEIDIDEATEALIFEANKSAFKKVIKAVEEQK